MKKLKLISPCAHRFTDKGSAKYHFPPLSLAVLAANTPNEFDIEIIDENYQDINLNDYLDADLIGITSMTATVKRGYEIADFFRKHGITVIMGGHHVSALPEEALQHADVVIVGEGDILWRQVTEEFLDNKPLHGIYSSTEPVSLDNLPLPREDLYPKDAKYLIRANTHMTRGCPNNCAFCSVTTFSPKFRKRPVDEVIAEMKYLKERGFKGVKIETIAFILDTQKKPAETIVESYITESINHHPQKYLTDERFPYWLIYRNAEFDRVADSMNFNVFRAYRDRMITKSITKTAGKIRVLKSRNIGNNEIINIPNYDCFIDDIEGLDVGKFLDMAGCVLLPNLTYNPRACFLPKGCITDGSVAILTLANPSETVTEDDLAFYATDKFAKFYAIARNMGTRSLNIDNNSVFFFGKQIKRL